MGGPVMPLPLEGVVVLDLSRALAGPFCTALLADMGATVFKVESVDGGDSSRSWPPFEGTHSLYFDSVNRGKQSIAVNFRSDAGRALLRRMALSVDVVVENFRAGVMADLGLDPDDLRAEKPELVVASITGFGATGPLSRAPGFDQVAQGMSGIMSITGRNSEDIFRVGLPIIDTVSGIFCALGIASALAGRGVTGRGASVATSLLESAIAISTFQGQQYLSRGEIPHPHGNDHPVLAPYGVFATADIPIIVAVGNQEQWRSLCEVLGLSELMEHPHFESGSSRSTHREDLKNRIEARLLARSGTEWVTMLQSAQIPCGPIYTYDQVFDDPQVKALDMVTDLHRDDGSRLPLIRGPLSVNGSATPVPGIPPALGQDTREILRALHFTEAEITDLERARTVQPHPEPLAAGSQG